MKENNLLASVALFSELYNNNKDIYDIIAKFLIEAIRSKKKWSFTSIDATGLLEEVFDFKIPDAVIKTTIKNRLKRDDIVSLHNGVYTINTSTINSENEFAENLETTKSTHNSIFKDLVLYVETQEGKTFSEGQIGSLYESFSSYLLDYNEADKYFKLISSFIIENQTVNDFKKNLNIIKDGLLLYTGIRFTPDLNNLGSWNTDLMIFLDTEHLFNAVGYNGIIYCEIFADFYSLIVEINNSSKNKTGNKKIELKYFEENRQEIESFFYKAEQIILGKEPINPSRPAMLAIVEGCRSASDIVAKKTQFYADLRQMGIELEAKVDYYKNHDYTVEDQDILKQLTKISLENGRQLDENECMHYLKLFTKINVLRKGISGVPFENCRYVFMSANSTTLFIAHNEVVKFNDRDVPFATDIDFITNKFWFKLKKGFNDKNSIPKSFDIVTKAQVILSSQITASISIEFDRLTKKYRKGEINQQTAIELSHNLRERPSKPEDITLSTVKESLEFLSRDNMEIFLHEKSLLMKKIAEGEKAKDELSKIQKNKRQIQKNKAKKNANLFLYLMFTGFVLAIAILIGITAFYLLKLIHKLSNFYDSLPDLIGLVALFFLDIVPLFKWKTIINFIIRKYKKIYKKKLLKITD